MTHRNVYLAIDLGASSGRVVLGFLDRKQLILQEIHRFINRPVQLNDTLCWNVMSLWENIVKSLRICAEKGYQQLSGIGFDCWGSDYALLCEGGQLLSPCVHYLDKRTEKIEKVISCKIKNGDLYRLTGFPISRFPSMAQLVSVKNDPLSKLLTLAHKWLLISDLFRYFLCGQQKSELTAASSSQLLNLRTANWCSKLFKLFHLPLRIMPDIIKPGTITGKLKPDVCSNTGLKPAPVIAVPGHDTACAAAALPLIEPDSAFLICGTWSIFGLVNNKPITTDKALRLGFINEFGLDSVLFVKNMMGLYLIESLRRTWQQEGTSISYAQIIREAVQAKPFKVVLDVNCPLFFAQSNPLESLNSFLRNSNQTKSFTRGEMIRALLEGMVFAYRESLTDLEEVTGRKYGKLCMVGGGVRNRLLCQMIADGLNIEVVAGLPEATVVGNLATQALATGQIGNSVDIRNVIANSFKLQKYKPKTTKDWDKKFSVYKEIVKESKALKNK